MQNCCPQFRTLSNYRDPQFLGPRIGDKLIFSLLIMSLYWKVGKVCDRRLHTSTPITPMLQIEGSSTLCAHLRPSGPSSAEAASV